MLEVTVDGPTGQVPAGTYLTMLSAAFAALEDVQGQMLGRSEGQPEWVVKDLHSSSPTTVLAATKPAASHPANVSDTVEARFLSWLNYLETGTGELARFNIKTLKRLRSATSLVGVDTIVRGLTVTAVDNPAVNGNRRVHLTRASYRRADELLEGRRESIGSLVGHVQGLTEYNGDRIKIVDSVTNKTVDVRLNDDLAAKVASRAIWKKEVRVRGRIIRDRRDGRPREIHATEVEEVRHPSDVPTAAEMRGAYEGRFGPEDSVAYVRQLRDG